MKLREGTNFSEKLAEYLEGKVPEGFQVAITYPELHRSIVVSAKHEALLLLPKEGAADAALRPIGNSPRYIHVPEPVIQLPVPSWVVDGDVQRDDLTSIWMFASEARGYRGAIARYVAQLNKIKESL